MAYQPQVSDRQAKIDAHVAAAEERRRKGGHVPVIDPPPSMPVPPPPPPAQQAAPAIKGAVKVAAFPERTRYPFREIADDGGVWKLDPAAYGPKTKAQSIRTSASKWARDRGLRAKVVIDDGLAYVQFGKAEP